MARVEPTTIIRQIEKCLKEKDIRLLKQIISDLDAFDVADAIELLDPEKQVVTFRLLAKEKALEVFEYIEAPVQQQLLQNFTDERAIEVFSWMEPDDRIRLMEELPAGVAKRLLHALSPKERDMTDILLGYQDGTAGHIMTPKYIRLPKDLTVQKALDKIRSSGGDLETVYHLYVTDERRKIEGVVSIVALVMADPQNRLEEIMETDPVRVRTDEEEEVVAHLLKDSDLVSVPVVDTEDRLVGVITVDDAIDILEDEATEAALDKAGFVDTRSIDSDRSRILISGSLLQVWRVRVPFLMITLIGGLLAGVVMARFESVLAAVTAVAFFVPVIMGMGGNVGAQSSTIFTRALALGQIQFKRFLRQLGREVLIGASMGLVIGLLAGAAAFIWQGNLNLSIVIVVSLLLTIMLATTLGFFIPFVLVKLGMDQAAGATPIITTIKDISGLLIYFLFVSLLL